MIINEVALSAAKLHRVQLGDGYHSHVVGIFEPVEIVTSTAWSFFVEVVLLHVPSVPYTSLSEDGGEQAVAGH